MREDEIRKCQKSGWWLIPLGNGKFDHWSEIIEDTKQERKMNEESDLRRL
jgi:hypothetical protein